MSDTTAGVFARTGGSTAVAANVEYRLGRLGARQSLAGRWLDCGCADAGYAVGLLERGTEHVFGVDLTVDDLRQARLATTDNPTGTLSFGCAASEALPFAEAVFDGVLLNEVLEHVADEARTLRELFRVLRPGGTLALMSPNRFFPFEGHGMHVGSHDVLVPIPLLPWLPRAAGERFMRARNYWPGELAERARGAGFRVAWYGSVFPVFEVYPVLPSAVVRLYRMLVPLMERVPGVRKFGVSTLVVARKPVAASRGRG